MDTSTLEIRINHNFKDRSLLLNALTHSSYANEHRNSGSECNERMEFVGDSVLGFVCAELLFKRFPDKPEGVLSKMRSSLVCETALAGYALSIDLGDFLLLGHGESLAGGRERPSTLADAFEALIAAIYFDAGVESAKAFVLPFLTDALDNDKYTHVLSRD